MFRVYIFSLRRQLNERSAEHDTARIIAKILHKRKNVVSPADFVSPADCERKLEKIVFLLELNTCLAHKALLLCHHYNLTGCAQYITEGAQNSLVIHTKSFFYFCDNCVESYEVRVHSVVINGCYMVSVTFRCFSNKSLDACGKLANS